tara:strand:- start:395 stop:640 length:246 start_codon:yes stop_codon:yes gene_type:complete
MPRYSYLCEECGITYQKVHSIKEKLSDCEECSSEGTLKRIPSVPYIVPAAKTSGKLVDKHIEETKKEVEEEKRRLKRVEYE